MLVSRSAAAIFLVLAISASSASAKSLRANAAAARRRTESRGRALKRPSDEILTIGSDGSVEDVVKIKGGKPKTKVEEPSDEDPQEGGDEEEPSAEDPLEVEDDGPEDGIDDEEPSAEDNPDEVPDDGPDDVSDVDEPDGEDEEPSAEDPISAEDPDDAWDGDWELVDVGVDGDGTVDACVLREDGNWKTASLSLEQFGDLSISESVEGTCADICATSKQCHCVNNDCELVTGVQWTDFI